MILHFGRNQMSYSYIDVLIMCIYRTGIYADKKIFGEKRKIMQLDYNSSEWYITGFLCGFICVMFIAYGRTHVLHR